ncbi:glycoprotein 6-alpha-L-fucosyltransferase [Entomortierella parvispora]|uniref:Glycoprotein 6-alpha-L-fucosyltransferase n=1 Tax=Entomortierella parvispora TaxID=205924 RepID=A0A9P3HCX2_9FUNG|nr:glycoprotein 6-alpha-L-fucosyltransferase [Entomortierella parvispora]
MKFPSNPKVKRLFYAVAIACGIGLMVHVHNVMLYRLITDKRIEGYTHLKEAEKRSLCPLPQGDTVCVRTEASKAALVDICGDFPSSIGSCQDQTYGSIVTTKDHIVEVSKNTLRIIVQGEGSELGEAIDKFVQRRSRWMVDILHSGGYELLTTFEDPRRLAYLEQLDSLQHRCTNFFNGAVNGNGFGSKWHTVALGLSLGLYHNMTLVTPEVLNNFIPLTSCTEADMERAFRESPPLHVFADWTESTVNFQTIGSDLNEMVGLSKSMTRTPGFDDKDLFWLRTMVTYYATRPNHQFREQFRRYSPIQTPCMSVHVRHSDKHWEATLLEFPDYIDKAEEYKRQTGVSNIYLMSDDSKVIKSSEEYKNFRFQYLNVPRPNEAWYTERARGMPMDMLERDFLLDVYAAAQCEHQILTYSSNVGRLIGELSFALRNSGPSLVSLDSEWAMWP